MNISTIGLDLAKNAFQVHGVNQQGKAVLSKTLKRADVMSFFAKLLPCLNRDRGLRKCALLGAQTHRARPHGKTDGATVRQAIRKDEQERCA